MYDFTAPHIYRTTRSLLKNSTVDWQQTLGPKESLPTEDDVDSTKANDIPESSVVRGLKRVASDRFGNAFAHIGAGKTFASAYHIKVAVRDDRAFWLSSGTWQSSNQPDIDFFDENADRQLITLFNREPHDVCENRCIFSTKRLVLMAERCRNKRFIFAKHCFHSFYGFSAEFKSGIELKCSLVVA
jgi:hypothetical protein